MATEANLWIRRPNPLPQPVTRLVCLPHAGGSASFYFPFGALLRPDIEMLAVQYPGRQDRRAERLVDNIPELADALAGVLAAAVEGPYAIFGHSMGAILGFEVARRLAGSGAGPTHLFASGRRAPSTVRRETVHLRDDDGLVAELRQLSGTAGTFLDDRELLAMILPATRNDYRAIETYVCTDATPLDCPITVLTGDADPKCTLDEASAWDAHTTAGCALRVFPGGHFYLNDNRPAVAREIRAGLLDAVPSPSTAFWNGGTP